MAPAPRSCVFTASRRQPIFNRKVLPELASRELEGVAMDFPGLGLLYDENLALNGPDI